MNRSPEDRGGWMAPESIALMGPVVIVEAQEAVERTLQRRPAREVPAAEDDPPVLLQDRPLQPFDEAIGPGMSRLRPGVANAQRSARLIEGALELRAAVGQDPLNRPARATIVRDTTVRRKVAAAVAVKAGSSHATPYEPNASQAVICQTLPTLLSWPM